MKELGKLCPKDHAHQHLIGGRAEKAAVYPEGLCRATCKGVVRQIEFERSGTRSLLSLNVVGKAGDVPETEEEGHHWQAAWDDVSGKELNPAGVMAARALEIKHVNLKSVWRKIPRAEATKQGCNIVGTRWVDIDKGDEKHRK